VRTERDLRQHGLPRTRVLAAVVRLLDETSIRIGNEEYRRENKTFGLTTLRQRHAKLNGSTLRFEFTGKAGKQHVVELSDRRLVRIISRCQELPGQELFQYLDDDQQRHSIESEDVNAYLREISGGDFSAKDFRTWNGTVLAMRYLQLCPSAETPTAGKREVSAAIKRVAAELGNTPAVCRKAYVHPVVVDAYLEGSLISTARVRLSSRLSEDERCVARLLAAGTMKA
jgi:DNA topoisomerase-1